MEFSNYFSILLISSLLLVLLQGMYSSHGLNSTDLAVKRSRSRYKYPPGPRGLPFIGVAHLLPPVHFGTVTSKWAERYGEMMTLQLGGVRWVYLNSSRVVTELLERRSAVPPRNRDNLTRRLLVLDQRGHLSMESCPTINGAGSHLAFANADWFLCLTMRGGVTFVRSCINF